MPDVGTEDFGTTLNLPSDPSIAPTDHGDGDFAFFEVLEYLTGHRNHYAGSHQGLPDVHHARLHGLSSASDHGAPTADLDMGAFKVKSSAAPSASSDYTTKSYVDGIATGVKWKAPVRVATTATGTFATAYANGQTVDGVVLVTGDRILLKDQASGAQNGIYTVNAAGGPSRATDADATAEVSGGMAVFVQEGTVNADTGWLLSNDGTITIGTTVLTFVQFTSLGQVTAGAGLTKTGSQIDVVAADGTITVAADSIKVAIGGITDTEVAAANKDGAAGTASMRTLGTTATKACAGNDARLSDTRTPTDASVTLAKLASALVDILMPWNIVIPALGQVADAATNWSTFQIDTAQNGNGYLQSTGAQNAEVNFDVMLAAGTWTINLIVFKAGDSGIYTVQLDGSSVGTLDGWQSPGVRKQILTLAGVAVATTAKKRLKLLMATKNASSSGYFGYVSFIHLQRTA